MLTDEDLTTRLEEAFRADAPELEYAGAMPHVRRRGTLAGGLAATAMLAAGAALALAPDALQHDRSTAPESQTRPSAHPTVTSDGSGRHTLRLAGLRLTYAEQSGQGDLAYVVGSGLTVPSDAQMVDLDIPADVWFVDHPAEGEPAMYVAAPGTSSVYGVLAPGWTRDQLVDLLKHATSADGRTGDYGDVTIHPGTGSTPGSDS